MKKINIISLIATCFYIGKIPIMPGTLGALMGFVLYFTYIFLGSELRIFHSIYDLKFLIFCCVLNLILFIIGIMVSDKYEEIYSKKDPGEVIIDEVVAQSVIISGVIFLMPFMMIEDLTYFKENKLKSEIITFLLCLFSFISFRFFDILKPWPINEFDKKYDGGFGIMIDDIICIPFSILLTYFLTFSSLDLLRVLSFF